MGSCASHGKCYRINGMEHEGNGLALSAKCAHHVTTLEVDIYFLSKAFLGVLRAIIACLQAALPYSAL